MVARWFDVSPEVLIDSQLQDGELLGQIPCRTDAVDGHPL